MKIIKLNENTPRNTVVMIVGEEYKSSQPHFLYVSEDGKLSPFWRNSDGSWNFCGAFRSWDGAGHQHWYGYKVAVIASHVTNPSKIKVNDCVRAYMKWVRG